ncbi:PREDICTED: uncharacterized protein LOC104773866 [Camelina sativa]|uniref:Uncharacterized protein LOC104705900 n=2 Tax=Camelina sativa TaxID=90675 RepID=A0ABM0XEM3_CAMSA|nr:PREDICTED: uncharacterized protein LOC104705900 [Camelina sativa]XP_010484801.1 PREDICTED: uncharacterized protein LOC104763084 [Camelina sativa]XP_010496838.1 PREDICTED: uncharacterized protein LOC104773866 [Camelina sativa]
MEQFEADPYYADQKRARKLEAWRQAIADGDLGMPRICPCGERIVNEISPTETEKKRWFTCVKYKDDGLHRRKNWADAIEEETQTLRKDVDNHWERLKEFEPHHTQIYNLQMQLKEKSDEIAKLREEVALLTTRVDLLDRLCFD